MRGSIRSQVEYLFRVTVDRIGLSKHEAKAQARAAGASNWHELGKSLGVHSFGTKNAYLDVWKQCFSYARSNFGIKDIEKLASSHVEKFLEHKIGEGVKYSTLKQYMSAVEKLETALNRYAHRAGTGREYSFDLRAVREEARDVLERSQVSRAYENPREIIGFLKNEIHRLAAQLQLECGARLSEVNRLTAQNLRGSGVIHLDNCKGGRERDVRVSEETYRRLEAHVSEHGSLSFDKDDYRQDIKQACERSFQEYNGSHGFRWNYAQEAVLRYQFQGYTYEESLQRVAVEMGHNREDITRHYLRVR